MSSPPLQIWHHRVAFLLPDSFSGSSVNIGWSLPPHWSELVSLRVDGAVALDKSVLLRGGALYGSIQDGLHIIDSSAMATAADEAACAHDAEKVLSTSTFIGAAAARVPLAASGSTITLDGTASDKKAADSSTTYFRVSAAALAAARTVQFVIRGGDTVVVDVVDDVNGELKLTNLTQNLHHDSHAVWNFKDFSKVSLVEISDLRATVVAPTAAVALQHTVVTGAVFGASLDAVRSEVLRREVAPDCNCAAPKAAVKLATHLDLPHAPSCSFDCSSSLDSNFCPNELSCLDDCTKAEKEFVCFHCQDNIASTGMAAAEYMAMCEAFEGPSQRMATHESYGNQFSMSYGDDDNDYTPVPAPTMMDWTGLDVLVSASFTLTAAIEECSSAGDAVVKAATAAALGVAEADIVNLEVVCTCASNGYTLNLHDSWGDGWNGNTLSVAPCGEDGTEPFASGIGSTFNSSHEASDSVCLPDDLAGFTVTVGGGSFLSEVSFDMIGPDGTAVLTGSGAGTWGYGDCAARRLGAIMYDWHVSFGLRIPLEDTGSATATDYTYVVASSLGNMGPAISVALGFDVAVAEVLSTPVVEMPFACYISDCGCPGAFAETWCSSDSALITADWCNLEEANCAGSCNGNICYPDTSPTPAPVAMECYISQCGCPDAFAHSWCSEATAMITSPWCEESAAHCEGHCSGSFCEAGLEVVPVVPLGECYISQCGCPGSFTQTWCEETNAKITSPWCGENADNCGSCSGTYCTP